MPTLTNPINVVLEILSQHKRNKSHQIGKEEVKSLFAEDVFFLHVEKLK